MYISSYLGLRQSLIHIQRTSVEVVHAVFLCNKDLIKSSDFEIENSLYLQVLEALPVTLYISYYMSYYSWLYLGCWYLTYALQSYFVPNGKNIMVFWFNLWLLLQVLFFGWMNIRGNWGLFGYGSFIVVLDFTDWKSLFYSKNLFYFSSKSFCNVVILSRINVFCVCGKLCIWLH